MYGFTLETPSSIYARFLIYFQPFKQKSSAKINGPWLAPVEVIELFYQQEAHQHSPAI